MSTSRYWGRDWDHDFDDDREDRLPAGMAICPACGGMVPESHLETDTGNCIECEDREIERREEAESAPYALCLMGLQPKRHAAR